MTALPLVFVGPTPSAAVLAGGGGGAALDAAQDEEDVAAVVVNGAAVAGAELSLSLPAAATPCVDAVGGASAGFVEEGAEASCVSFLSSLFVEFTEGSCSPVVEWQQTRTAPHRGAPKHVV